jgi:hypothetical protein
MPSTREDHTSLLREPAVERCLAGRRGRAAARLHRCSRTSARPLVCPFSRANGRPRAPLWLLQMYVPTSTTVGRSSTPAAVSRSGRLPCFDRVASIEGNHRMSQRPGAEDNRSSTLPVAIARRGDFAPTSTCSGASCRGRPSLALSGVTRGESETAIAARACKARERQGRATPSFREETRRSPTRGAFHPKVVRERTKAFCRPANQPAVDADAFFTAEGAARGDARAAPGSSVNRWWRPANQPLVDRPQRPL